jgi:UDP-N-acetylmuramyl pentapeptide synthase
MGVCLAINTRMNDDAEYFICEMGAYVPGEIAQICQLTHPQISILTEIGPQHLERFKSLRTRHGQNMSWSRRCLRMGSPCLTWTILIW